MTNPNKPVFAIGLGFREQGYVRFEKVFCQREASGNDAGNVAAVQNFLNIAEKMLSYKKGNQVITLKGANMKQLKQTFEFHKHGGTVDFLKAAKGRKKDAIIVIMATNEPPTNLEESYLIMELFSAGTLNALNPEHRNPLTKVFAGLPTIWMSIGGIPEDYHEAHDKFPSWLMFNDPGTNRFAPTSFARYGACFGSGNTLMMGAAVNFGVSIGNDNLLDGHCSIASCVQMGDRNKVGSFVSMEGVLSPVNEKPVVVGNDNFFGTRCRVGTGLVIGDSNFWGSGVDVSKGVKLRDMREDSKTFGQYVYAGTPEGIQGQDKTMLYVNRMVSYIGGDPERGILAFPGEIVLIHNTKENQERFERNDDLNANNWFSLLPLLRK